MQPETNSDNEKDKKDGQPEDSEHFLH